MVFIAVTIFLLTVGLSIWRTQQWERVIIAWGGAVLMLIVGAITTTDLIVAWETIGNPLLSLLATLLVTYILKGAGFFRVAAQWLSWLGLGKGLWLWGLVAIVAILSTLLGNNYSSILLWTPVMLEISTVLGFRPRTTLAYLTITSIVTDVVSLLLPQSNPVNLLATRFTDIAGFNYFLVMLPVTVVALATSLVVIWLCFAAYIPLRYPLKRKVSPATLAGDSLVCSWGVVIVGLLLVSSWLGIWSWLLGSMIALFTLALAGRWWQPRSSIIPLAQLFADFPWQIVLWVGGVYFVVLGVGKAGIISLSSQLFSALAGWGLTLATIGAGFVAMLLSGVTQNLPVALINAQGIQETFGVEPIVTVAMTYGNLIGCTVGAKVTPIGSISGLLWLTLLQRQGFRLQWKHYLKLHLIIIVPTLFLSLLMLSMWLPWLIV